MLIEAISGPSRRRVRGGFSPPSLFVPPKPKPRGWTPQTSGNVQQEPPATQMRIACV